MAGTISGTSNANFSAVQEAHHNAQDQRVAASEARAANGQTKSLQRASTVQNGGTKAPSAPPPPSPSTDAGAAACSGGQGYATAPAQDPKEKALEELKNDPDYALLVQNADALKTLGGAFEELERLYGKDFDYPTGKRVGDHKLSWDDIEYAVTHQDRGASREAMQLADFLLKHRDLFDKMDSNKDGMIEPSDIQSMIHSLNVDIHTKEANAIKAASSAPAAGGSAPPAAAGAETAPQTGQGTGESYQFNQADLAIRPFSSTATGTGELLADSMGHVQSEIERLTNLKAKALAAGKPEDAAKIDVQINKMNMCLQMVMSAMQQQQTMLSNIAKMWSDMAMTAIRNTH